MKNKRGFTLLELLICVALISVVIVFLFRLINTIRHDEQAVGYIRANQASRNQFLGEVGSIISENAVCSFSTANSTPTHGIINMSLCTGKNLIIDVEKSYVRLSLDGVVSKYPMKDEKAWYNPSLVVKEGTYYGYAYHKIVIKSEKKGLESTPIDDIEIFWVDRNGGFDPSSQFSQFITGKRFNEKIRRLANPSLSCTYDQMFDTAVEDCYFDEYITRIVRSNTLDIVPLEANVVSTPESFKPIYAWYNNGTIYIYSEMPTLVLNMDASWMFSQMTQLTDLDLSYIDSTPTTTLAAMFRNDMSLQTIDLSSFNTQNVRSLNQTFEMPTPSSRYGLTGQLKNVIFGDNFTTSSVTSMRYTFANNINLDTIDLSKFDTTRVTDVSGFLSRTQNLEYVDLSTFDLTSVNSANFSSFLYSSGVKAIKTPKKGPVDNTAGIDLPTAMYDSGTKTVITKWRSSSPLKTTISTYCSNISNNQVYAITTLYLRTGPGSNYDTSLTVPAGTYAPYTETRTEGNYTWYKIEYNGSVGWAAYIAAASPAYPIICNKGS